MKIELFKCRSWGTLMTVLCLLGVPAPINSLAETPPADTAPTTGELPPNIYPTSPLAQVIRLSQAGVDPSIIQTFVANSSSTFNLDSDKIIYLRDIGLPNEVITAMLQRDQVLQQQMAATAYQPPPTAPAPETTTETEPAPPADQPAPPPTEVTVNNFYDTLAPYGSWVNVEGYGRCWRPSVVIYNPGWQPYCDHGRWVYTDCGWYWCSDYSWGWAPFHYGRWFQNPHLGWCWTPDTVWGPSWVTWRYSSGYCGWAPLPPFSTYQAGVGFFYRGNAVSIGFSWGLNENCFTFVPTQRFCDPHPRRYCAAPAQVTQIFNQTTVINNYNGHGHNLVNRGIDPERITAVTRTPIRPVALRDTGASFDRGPHGDQLSRDGRTLTVSSPPQTWSSTQNHFRPPNDNRPGTPAHPIQQPQAPTGITHNPQEGNAVRVPPQHPMPPASYNSSPVPAPASPNNNHRTDSPRGWEQTQSRGNAYNPTPSGATPQPGQGQPHTPGAGHRDAPVAAPVQPAPQHSQPSSPPPSSSQRSSGQNPNQSGSGNGPGNTSSYGPRH